MNDDAVELVRLEAELLQNLSNADEKTILDDIELIQGLQDTKEKATLIEENTLKSKINEKKINLERNKFKPVAREGSMLYFLIISLNEVCHMYQYSLESFTQFFYKAIFNTTETGDERI